MKGEKEFCNLIQKAHEYVESRRNANLLDPNEMVIVYMLSIEHLYYKVGLLLFFKVLAFCG